MKVLVIDDNADAAESLALMLRAAGHQVEAARDGDSGIAAAIRQPPEAVLLDIGLPGESGYRVAKRLLQILPRKPLLIAFTGYGQEADLVRARAVGFDHHFLKGEDPRHLVTWLEKHAATLHPSE
jgi:CheY-like chemotaxis protein